MGVRLLLRYVETDDWLLTRDLNFPKVADPAIRLMRRRLIPRVQVLTTYAQFGNHLNVLVLLSREISIDFDASM